MFFLIFKMLIYSQILHFYSPCGVGNPLSNFSALHHFKNWEENTEFQLEKRWFSAFSRPFMRFPNTHETNPTTPLIFVGVLAFHYLCPHPINIKLFLSNLEKIEKRIETTMDQRVPWTHLDLRCLELTLRLVKKWKSSFKKSFLARINYRKNMWHYI